MVATIQPRERSAVVVELGEWLVMEILLEEALALRKGEDSCEGVDKHASSSSFRMAWKRSCPARWCPNNASPASVRRTIARRRSAGSSVRSARCAWTNRST